jgi:hypothetical protein
VHGAVRKVLVFAPSRRDRSELQEASAWGFEPVFAGPDIDSLEEVDAERLVEELAPLADEGVVGTKDRAALLAAVVAHRRGLPGPDPAAIVRIQHKPTSRAIQAIAAPEAAPRFALLGDGPPPFPPPWFCKPVVGRLSQGTRRVEDAAGLAGLEEDERYSEGWERLAALAGDAPSARGYLVEEVVEGRECTLEGYVREGRVTVIGVTDSVFYPGTGSFERFEYPSSLPASRLSELSGVAERLLPTHGFDGGFFNVEFRVPEDGPAKVIEVNGRIASQFSPLVEAVHGVPTYRLLLRLACGDDPGWQPAKRRGVAVSYAVRVFEDALVGAVPDVEPDVELYVEAGLALSEQRAPNDSSSFRVAILNAAAPTREEALGRCRARAAEVLRGLRLEPVPANRAAGPGVHRP